MPADAAEIKAAVNKAMGEGTLRLGSDPSLAVKVWPTDCVPLDVILGGGIPSGRSIELFGGFSVLKSYFGLRSIAAIQAAGGTAGLIDTEMVYDPAWAAQLGVDTDALLLQQPETGEDAVKIATTLIKNDIDVLVWDSVAASFPKAYADAEPGSSGEEKPARLAAMMSKAMARMTAANKHTALVFMNQTRSNIGGMSFGPKESTPGGRALPFYASIRVRLTRAGRITEDWKTHDGEKEVTVKRTTKIKIKAEVDKSKLNKPFREMWFIFDLNTQTIDETAFVVAQGIEHGLIVETSKARWSIPEWMDGTLHGIKQLTEWVDEEEDVLEWLKKETMRMALE